MKVKLCQPVCGQVGQVVDRDEKYARWLVREGYAVEVEDNSTSQSVSSVNTQSAKPSSKAKSKASSSD